MASFILLGIFLLTAFLVYRYKESSLYVLFFGAYTQNFLVAFLYTHAYIGKDLARGLLLLKDFILLELFVWSIVAMFKHFRRPWPGPLIPLVVLTCYCTLRFLFGVIFLGDDWSVGLYRVRNIFFPLEILVVVIVLTSLKPEFGRRFLRDITFGLCVLGVVAVSILLWAPRDFWVQNANIAELQADVKGDMENEMNFEEGLSLAGTMQGREALGFLSSFRATGTFGEALALAFSMSVPVLLLFFYFPRNVISVVSFTAAALALLFSLTRSAWIFCIIIGVYTLMQQRRYSLLAIAGGSVLALFLFWSPMAEFATTTVARLSPAADNPDSLHAEGMLWFYTRGLTDSSNILGKGMGEEAQDIPESGYAYLLEHFGMVAYLSFVWFCISLYRQLRKATHEIGPLVTVAQGIPLGIFITMHFSQYPFSLPCFLSLWYVVGLCLSSYLLPRKDFAKGPIHPGNPPPSFQAA